MDQLAAADIADVEVRLAAGGGEAGVDERGDRTAVTGEAAAVATAEGNSLLQERDGMVIVLGVVERPAVARADEVADFQASAVRPGCRAGC